MKKSKVVPLLVGFLLGSLTTLAVVFLTRRSSTESHQEGCAVQAALTSESCCPCDTLPPSTSATTYSPSSLPSLPPSASPSVDSSSRYACSTEDETSISLGFLGGQQVVELEVPRSPEPGLCILTVVTSDGFVKPVARSYNQHDWEVSAGAFTALQLSCRNTVEGRVCSLELPQLQSTGSDYVLSTFHTPVWYNGAKDEVARFLEQATFGPTRASIQALESSAAELGSVGLAFANWIQQQQYAVGITSHRSIYRKRLNARMEVATQQGPVTHPCQRGTRYRKYAFSAKDEDKLLEITAVGNKRILRVDGFIRTVVDGPIIGYRGGNDSVEFTDGVYRIPGLPEPSNRLGGLLQLYHPGNSKKYRIEFNGIPGNPVVQFDLWIGAEPNVLVEFGDGAVSAIDTRYFQQEDVTVQEIILMDDLDELVCDSLGPPGNPLNPVFAWYNGSYWFHDSRFKTIENTVEAPANDGGGRNVRETTNIIQPGQAAVCSNAPRTFLNEDHCYMSQDPAACSSSSISEDEEPPDFWLELNHQTLRDIYFATGNGTETTRYLFAIDGLRVEDDPEAPAACRRRTKSRWTPVACTGAASNDQINELFGTMLSSSRDENPNVRDIFYGQEDPCPSSFMDAKGFEVQDLEGNCWRHVHPDHLTVYDMTYLVEDHPGGPQPIQQFALLGLTTLAFPVWHSMNDWAIYERRFGKAGRLGDWVHYYDLPSELRSQTLSDFFSFTADSIEVEDSDGVLVCGSPYEVGNDPMLGGSQGRGAFDSYLEYLRTSESTDFQVQKRAIWTKAVFEADDQLRQRVAWALAQILVISPDAIDSRMTEPAVTFYDIFVRNAFGNYFDILKEVAYNPLMAEMLTYYRSQSTAYVWRTSGNLEYADENFAREIMQLFTTGLVRINMDGTQLTDPNGDPIRVYTNDDIMEYARVWTGFVVRGSRGNIESRARNHVDPMKIDMRFRDQLPKMGLDRTYIGDGYPLCADLPEQHFLKKGATYRLLGKTPSPELLNDPSEWATDAAAERVTLEARGENSLFARLCGSIDSVECSYPSKVVLDETLECTGVECNVDTVRVVEVGDGVFYEYTRPACVYQAFFAGAKVAALRRSSRDLSCADPRTHVAGVACCDSNDRFWNDVYWGERTTFATAQQRCSGMELCSWWTRPSCNVEAIGTFCDSQSRFWTDVDCTLQVKIDGNGNAAILHHPEVDDLESEDIYDLVRPDDVKTFFRVDWSDSVVVNDIIADCESVASCRPTSDGMCSCDVFVHDEQVYGDGDTPTKEDVLANLHVGAFDPSLSSSFFSAEQIGSITVYKENGTLGISSVFEVINEAGVTVFRKNVKSNVHIVGTNLSFRNPLHFVSISDPELRDAEHETDAALYHYFYHPNTAPFLAIRFAQRFGISNPSPRYIREIATAFKTGSFSYWDGSSPVFFGSGYYGDIGATIACVLLDREARSIVLDADPSYGSLKEPLLKILGLMKALEFELDDDVDFIHFLFDLNEKIGQMAHEIPNVFSFFSPEYAPPGPVGQGSLISPEAQVLTGPRLIDSINGLFSLIKYGFSECFGGFAPAGHRPDCEEYVSGLPLFNDGALGQNTFIVPSDISDEALVGELATFLTSGRLSQLSRELINGIVAQETELNMKLIKAQQLIVAAPEFHTTNVVRRTGNVRPALEAPPPSSNAYKAVVYVLLKGGADTFNMLAPHSCTPTNSDGLTLLEQYYQERTSLAITEDERSRVINATGQPCSEFVIHEELEIVERLYNQGTLSFFANTGVINRPATKDNYGEVTKTQLFGHPSMQKEIQKIDPFDSSPATGVLGRMCDVLKTKGFNPQPITIEDSTVATLGVPGLAVDPLLVAKYDASEFIPKPDSEIFDARPYVEQLNGAAAVHKSVFGETYSTRLQKSIHDFEALGDALGSGHLNATFADTDYSQKLQRVSTLIASKTQRGTDRDVFYVALNRWDHHQNLKPDLARNFRELNEALTSFYEEMSSQGLWDNVTLVVTSDFGRTLTANSGEGSDHGWGGNYFVMGGAVRGGKIHGEYPADITGNGPLSIGRGRLIPTLSWESILNSVVEWMGADTEADKDYCLPNRIQTGTRLLSLNEVFRQI